MTEQATGIVGIVLFILSLIVIPMYFLYEGAPPRKNILTRILINILVCIGLIIFIVGLRSLAIVNEPSAEWLATLFLVFGLVYVGITLVADSIQVGAVLKSKHHVDPTTIGSDGEGAFLMYGPLGHLLGASMMASVGTLTLVTSVLPYWLGWGAFGIALVQLCFVPTLFSTTDPARLYSINGWNIPISSGLLMFWILIASTALVL